MTDSHTTHGALTEGVRKTMSGKGREGNKEGKGRLREPFTTSSSYVPREVVQPRAGRPRDVVVSATRLDEHTDLQAIEHLDFEQAKACEHSNHEALHEDEPASYLAEDWCAHCDAAGQFLLCHSGLVSLLTNHTKCRSCGGRNRGTTRIVQVLR